MEKVRSKVQTAFDRDDRFYGVIEKRPAEKVSSRSMRVPLELRPGGKFGHYNPDGGDLGLGDGPTFDKAVVDVVHVRHAIQWTKKAEWATDDNRKAVINTFRELLAKSMDEFTRNIDSLCMTNGSGVLGTITSVSTTVLTNDTYTLTTDGYGARLLRYGLNINVYDTTLTIQRTASGEVTIVMWDLANKQVRVSATVGSVQGTDKIVVSGLAGANPVSLLGVPYHHNNASTGFWLGFDRSVTPEIRANRVAAGGGFSLPFARLAVNKVGDRLGYDKMDGMVAWMHPCQLDAYEQIAQLVTHIERSGKESEEDIDLYYGSGKLAGCPVKESFSWDKTRIDFVNKSLWGRSELFPIGFYEVEGRKIFEIRGGSGGVATSQVFYLVVSFALYMDNPAGATYIDTLTVPAGY